MDEATPVEPNRKLVQVNKHYYNNSYTTLNVFDQVYYFDGELECFRGRHLPYGVIALIITAVILLSLPIYVLAITFNFIKVCYSQYVYVYGTFYHIHIERWSSTRCYK